MLTITIYVLDFNLTTKNIKKNKIELSTIEIAGCGVSFALQY